MSNPLLLRLGEELLHLEQSLAVNQPHSCRFCHHYNCSADKNCRCHCGTVHHTIQTHIDRLKEIIADGDDSDCETVRTPQQESDIQTQTDSADA